VARGALTFRQKDLTRALRATVAAGMVVQRIEIDKYGKITVVAEMPDSDRTSGDQHNEWDTVHS
jgi:hypothetical protein